MSAMRTKRRRVRNIPPDVLRAIHQELLTGASARQVYRAISNNKDLDADAIPSERTIVNIAREARPPDESGLWKVRDADPSTVEIVLSVLREAAYRTDGRVTSLTRTEARVIPVIWRAMAPLRMKRDPDESHAWRTYVWTRAYLSWARHDEDEEDFALVLAMLDAVAWRRPPATQQAIDRVLGVLNGWLPPEVSEESK